VGAAAAAPDSPAAACDRRERCGVRPGPRAAPAARRRPRAAARRRRRAPIVLAAGSDGRIAPIARRALDRTPAGGGGGRPRAPDSRRRATRRRGGRRRRSPAPALRPHSHHHRRPQSSHTFPSPPFLDGKTYKKPRRPFEKERLDAELQLVGEFGLRNKREVWRVQMALSKIRQAARSLLTLDDDDSKRIFEGDALMRRMYRYGLLDESQTKLDYVLALTPSDFLERRLQTLVFKLGLAKSVHHARVLIRQRHIRVGKQVVNVPSFMVRVDAQKHVDFALSSPFGGGRPGRNKRKAIAAKKARKAAKEGGGGEEEAEEDE